MRPPTKYPRHPQGPSGFGESGVRKLQRGGGEYQRTRPAQDILSIKAGGFYRVIYDGMPEYITAGRFDSKAVYRDTKRHQQKFLKAIMKPSMPRPVNLGNGVYASVMTGTPEGVTQQWQFDYEARPGLTQTAYFWRTVFPSNINTGGYYAKSRLTATHEGFYAFQINDGSTYVTRTTDVIANYGIRRQQDGDTTTVFGQTFVGLGSIYNGRRDHVNRQLHDPMLYRASLYDTPAGWVMNAEDFTRPDAEFWPGYGGLLVLKDFTVVLLTEVFFRPGLYDPEEDYTPKSWIVVTPNTEDFGQFTYYDVTDALFSDQDLPATLGAGENRYYSVTSGNNYNVALSLQFARTEMTAAGDNEFLITFGQKTAAGWRQRVGHVSVGNGALNALLAYESAASSSTSTTPFWQNVVHIGGGAMLAKVVAGEPGTNHAVSFRRSMDGGQTWGGEFAPAGFDAPLLNQYFGDFTVHKPYVPDDPSKKCIVLIPSWDPDEQAYYVYSSDDLGSTWARKGQIYKPSSFQRIDTMRSGDGGGNFESLEPGPSYARKPDITLPNRYEDRQ